MAKINLSFLVRRCFITGAISSPILKTIHILALSESSTGGGSLTLDDMPVCPVEYRNGRLCDLAGFGPR